jgi:hypothetical protein
MPSNIVPISWLCASPCTAWLSMSFIMTSWFIGMRAMRPSRVSNRASS